MRTVIACVCDADHYIRIFNSWTEAYEFPAAGENGSVADPTITGKPFNDVRGPLPSPPRRRLCRLHASPCATRQAYRYMDWLLTVPLLLIEIIFCMNLPAQEISDLSWKLGVASGLMIILGYPGELLIEEEQLGTRFSYWFAAMLPFLYVVYTLLIGLKSAINSEGNPAVAGMLNQVCWATVISWCTYPVVYLFPVRAHKIPSDVALTQSPRFIRPLPTPAHR